MQTYHRNRLIYEIFLSYTDEDHTIAMPDLLSVLEEQGCPADRRTVYAWIRDFNSSEERIIYVPGKKGYYLRHVFTEAEARILCDLIASTPSLSETVSQELTEKITAMLSRSQRKRISEGTSETEKTDNDAVPQNLGLLLQAIDTGRTVSFRYYDITVTRTRSYRRSKPYTLVPYALIFRFGRYYCVFYSPKRKDFAAYRLDKIDQMSITEEIYDRVPFDLSAWLRTSFNMYKGEASTITVRFTRDMAPLVIDQFGRNILIRSIDENGFTASIRTGISPTLISWLIQFHDRARVLQPQELIRQILDIAENLQKTYREEYHEQDRTVTDDHR